MKIVCVIVTFNGGKWIKKCLNSLKNLDLSTEIIVVDNNSSDSTRDIIKDDFPEVHLIENAVNLGFGKANNLGIERALNAKADFIFLLNQDAYWNEGSLKRTIEGFTPAIAVISPIHLTGNKENLDFGFANYLHPWITPGILKDFICNETRKLFYETEFVNAAAWVVKASVFRQVGLFHPVFDHYGEDNEFTMRLKKNNYKLLIHTESSIVHNRPQKRESSRFFNEDQVLLRKSLLDFFENGKENISTHKKYFLQKGLFYFLQGNFKKSMKMYKSYRRYSGKIISIEKNNFKL